MKSEQIKQKGNLNGTAMQILMGVLGGFAFSLLILLLLSFVMTVKDLPQNAVDPLACVSIVCGSFFGGWIAARIRRSQGMIYGAVTGFIFFLLLWATGAILHQTGFGTLLLIKLLLSIGFGCLGGIAGVNVKRKKQRI